jgi:phosphoribosylpyrophosphate synthetase
MSDQFSDEELYAKIEQEEQEHLVHIAQEYKLQNENMACLVSYLLTRSWANNPDLWDIY